MIITFRVNNVVEQPHKSMAKAKLGQKGTFKTRNERDKQILKAFVLLSMLMI
jgi:hypothetical protein